jgi:hypothetical protein
MGLWLDLLLKGEKGDTGSTWRDGSGAPSNGVGADGDYYLRTDTGDIYKRASGAYAIIVAGRRRPVVTNVNLTANYTILPTDEVICVTSISGASKTIFLPAAPTVGETYEIKDSGGNVSVDSTLVLDGNGHSIDAVSSKTLFDAYICIKVTYMNGAWALMNYEKTNLGT